jgi:bacterioferritin-associated ferredoxin
MQPDDKICYCYHVTLRKLYHYARRNEPVRPSQMSECLNAGTGCGWCIPILKRIHERVADGWELTDDQPVEGLPASPEEYSEARKAYIQSDQKNSFESD